MKDYVYMWLSYNLIIKKSNFHYLNITYKRQGSSVNILLLAKNVPVHKFAWFLQLTLDFKMVRLNFGWIYKCTRSVKGIPNGNLFLEQITYTMLTQKWFSLAEKMKSVQSLENNYHTTKT